MPENQDPAAYRQRVEAWRERAALLPEGDPQRATCLEIAEGYEKLANLIEAQQRDQLSLSRQSDGFWAVFDHGS